MSNTTYGFINLADGGGLKLGTQDGSDNVVCQIATSNDTITFSNTKDANPTYIVLNSAFYTTFGKTPAETASRITVKGNDATHALRIIDDNTTDYFDIYKSSNAIVLGSNTAADQLTINNRFLLTPGAGVTSTHAQITLDAVLATSTVGFYILSNVTQTNAMDHFKIETTTSNASSNTMYLLNTGTTGVGLRIHRTGVTSTSTLASSLYVLHTSNNASRTTAMYITTSNSGAGDTAAFEFDGDCIVVSAVSTPATTTGYVTIKDSGGTDRKIYYY